MKPTAVGFRRVVTDGLREDMRRIVECMMSLDLALNVDGTWYERATGHKIHANHLRCMLRADYIRNGGALRGAALQKHLDAALRGAGRAVKEIVAEERPGMVVNLPVEETYL